MFPGPSALVPALALKNQKEELAVNSSLARRQVALERLRVELRALGVEIGPRIERYVQENLAEPGYSVPQIALVLDLILGDARPDGRLKRTQAFWTAVEEYFRNEVGSAFSSVQRFEELQNALGDIRVLHDSLAAGGLWLSFSVIAGLLAAGVSEEELIDFQEEYGRADGLDDPEQVLTAALRRVEEENLTFACALEECVRASRRPSD